MKPTLKKAAIPMIVIGCIVSSVLSQANDYPSYDDYIEEFGLEFPTVEAPQRLENYNTNIGILGQFNLTDLDWTPGLTKYTAWSAE